MEMIKYKPVETDGKFTLCLAFPVYKQIKTSGKNYIRNTKTGENCGQQVLLCTNIYVDPVELDEDCYEIVREEENENGK